MKYKTLGNTGLLVSQLCLGTMTFSDGSGIYKHIGDVDQAGADEQVRVSIGAGINFFDTADVYSAGASEVTLGQSFRNLGIARTDVVLATKVASRGAGAIRSSCTGTARALRATAVRTATAMSGSSGCAASECWRRRRSLNLVPYDDVLRRIPVR